MAFRSSRFRTRSGFDIVHHDGKCAFGLDIWSTIERKESPANVVVYPIRKLRALAARIMNETKSHGSSKAGGSFA